jgi:hypothetical protein
MFSFGFAAGSWLKTVIYDNQPWELFRWEASSMGYRPIPYGSMLGRTDKIIMAVRLDQAIMPNDRPYLYERNDTNQGHEHDEN